MQGKRIVGGTLETDSSEAGSTGGCGREARSMPNSMRRNSVAREQQQRQQRRPPLLCCVALAPLTASISATASLSPSSTKSSLAIHSPSGRQAVRM